jgi:hypothetical protein
VVPTSPASTTSSTLPPVDTVTTAINGTSDTAGPVETPAPKSGLSATDTLIVIICSSVGGCIVVGGVMTAVACCVLRPKKPSSTDSAQYNAVAMNTYQGDGSHSYAGSNTSQNHGATTMSLAYGSTSDIDKRGYNKGLAYAGVSSSTGLDSSGDVYAKPDFDKPDAGAAYVQPHVMFAGETVDRSTLQRTYTVPDIDTYSDAKPKY